MTQSHTSSCPILHVLLINSYTSLFLPPPHSLTTCPVLPSHVSVQVPSEARVGDVIGITCLAENSNPPADVTLVINGQTPPGASSRMIKVDHGGWNTITNLSNYEVRVPADSEPTDLNVNCYALNQAIGSTEISTKVVSVLSEYHQIPTSLIYMYVYV